MDGPADINLSFKELLNLNRFITFFFQLWEQSGWLASGKEWILTIHCWLHTVPDQCISLRSGTSSWAGCRSSSYSPVAFWENALICRTTFCVVSHAGKQMQTSISINTTHMNMSKKDHKESEFLVTSLRKISIQGRCCYTACAVIKQRVNGDPLYRNVPALALLSPLECI